MSTTRDPDRIFRAWLEQMPDEAPDRAITAVLQATKDAAQVRRLPFEGRWRSSRMNRLSLIAAVAVIVLALVGGAYLLVGSNSSKPAPPTASPAAASPTPTSRPTAEPVVALPATIWGDWHADGVDVPSVATNQLLRLSLSWQDGRAGWIQFDRDFAGVQKFQFTPLAAPDGELRLRTLDASSGCGIGDVGRYRWTRSTDGLFLTLVLIADDCAARGSTFARTWVHSLSAVSDGGTGVIPSSGWIQATLPKTRFAMGGGTDAADIHRFNENDPFLGLIQLIDPMGFQAPCATANKPFAITPTVAAFETYLGTLPGLQLGTSTTKVDGISGRRFEGVAVADPTCKQADRWLFRSHVPTETGAAWSYQVGDKFTIWAIVRNGHLNVFSWDGDRTTLAEGQAVIDSIKFLDVLPTP